MPFNQKDAIEWYFFDLFAEEKSLIQAVVTRKGGISPHPWASLNMATSVGDSRENVLENRRRIQQALGLQKAWFFDVWQVHGTNVIATRSPRLPGEPHQKADAMMTDHPEVALLMLFADCVPIFLYDPIHRAIALVHAGWQGTVSHVVQHAVSRMKEYYGTKTQDLLAGIGPSICQKHYEVGEEVIERVRTKFQESDGLLSHTDNGKAHFDLWQANLQILLECGLQNDHIQVSGICTVEDPERWYSHRGEQGKTGRFGAVLALRQ
ncbi:uncharacterized protein, YfiH family [Anaerolinea thermolimosa]|uniref:peptidoglycan editing factor PgeF n=1 Tax=Anaerolinea thermolimosa TaxID=229919 RepID=UPI000785DB60|nr:peptidoglycan editing factor PgeF [Anaerolinea thermolimosa]GAP06657.1 uncharacterized protein, YfiH family [Anaerolinea thermolimosa]